MNEIHMLSELSKSKDAFSLLELFYNFKEIDKLDLFLLDKDEAVKKLEELGLIERLKDKMKITDVGIETFRYLRYLQLDF